MTIADKLALLEQTKEAQRIKLGLPKNIPFSQYVKFIRDPFTPAELFANGEKGVWLDPSDLSTMFQDVSGKNPVTKDGQPVGLILDKSQGLEKVSYTFKITNTGEWVDNGDGSYTSNGTTNAGGNLFFSIDNYGRGNKTFEVSYKVTRYESGSFKFWRPTDGGYTNEVGEYKRIFHANSGEIRFLSVRFVGDISDITVREIKGNHATQETASARPIYRTDGDLHWLEFDGVDDFLSADFNPTAISTLHFFSGAKGTGTDTDILYSTSYNKSVPVINKTLTGNITGIGYVPNGEAYTSIRHSKPVSQPFVNTDVFDYTANTFAYTDGLDESIVTSISNPKTFDRLLISSQVGNSFFMSGNLYGLIVGVNMNITDNSLVMYLANKSGVIL